MSNQSQQWVSVYDRVPDVPEGEEEEVIVCVRRARNGRSYVFSARYLNEYPLYNEYDIEADDDGYLASTGWYDVKANSEFDGWYSPLIDIGSGDTLTHWMPLPDPPTSKGESQ